MRKLFESFVSSCAALAAYLFVLAGAMLTYEVIARYFFTKPTIWAAELSQMCLIWGTLLAMAKLLKTGQHIQVDAIVRHLPFRVATVLNAIVMMIVAIFAAVVCYFGYEIFYDSFERGRTTGSMLNVPIWIVEFAVPFGFALLFVQALLCSIDAIRKVWRSNDEHSSAASTP
ncbi:MAG: TRAP transporter small permease [Granulosicoccus sp.]